MGLLLLLLCLASTAMADCVATSCRSCTENTWLGIGCRWCPKTNKCHAPGSLFNDCQTSITDNGKCPIPAGQRTAYDKDRAFFLMWLSGAAYKGRFLTAKNLPPDFAVLKHYNIPIHLFQNLVSFIGVSHKHRRIVVTNRGTPGLSVQLLQQAVDTGPDTFPGSKTVVLVNYFRDASFRMVSKIQADLAEIVKSFPDYGVTFTGHSLGGAIAEVEAVRFAQMLPLKDLEVYTFGEPRIGNEAWNVLMLSKVKRYFRIVNDADPIPHYPNDAVSLWKPRHAATEIWFASGNRCGELRECTGGEDSSCSNRHNGITQALNLGDHQIDKYLNLLAPSCKFKVPWTD